MKPVILVLSGDDETTFRWLSGGWNEYKKSGTPEARQLMQKARECITAGQNVPDTIRRLRSAGFDVYRK